MALQVVAGEKLSAVELLDKYSQNQEAMRSFILKAEITSENKSRFSNKELKHLSDDSQQKAISEVRYDGKRVKHICRILSDTVKKSSKESTRYLSNLFDGNEVWQYAKIGGPSENPTHRLIIKKQGRSQESQKRDPYFGFNSFLLGRLEGDYERVDSILLDADKISVGDKTETVGDLQCYVVEADSDNGEYKIWIDPEHGYNIARVIVRKKNGDNFYNRRVSKGESVLVTVDNVKFRQIDDVWLPVEAKLMINNKLPNGDFWKTKVHHKLTDIKLNPDHEKLAYFGSDEIQNGTIVYVDTEKTMTYTWQDGELIPNTDAVIVYEVEKITPENITMENPLATLLAIASDPQAEAGAIESSGLMLPVISLEDLLNNYAATMEKSRAFSFVQL